MDWNSLRACGLILAATALVSCGGGGGSGSSSSSSSSSSGGGSGNIQFSADRTSVSFEYIEGGVVPAAQQVIITATGSYSGTLYLGAVASGQGLDATIPLTVISDTQGSFQVRAGANLPVGTYTGTLQLMACSDQNCTRQVGNSPITINYSTTVHTSLHVSAQTVNLSAVSGNSTTQDVTVTLPWQYTSFTTQVDDPSWLTVTSPTATTLRLTARSIPVSTRQNRVVVSSGGYSLPITVNYNVTPPPGGEFDLRASPTSITLSAIEGTVSAPVTLNVSGPTWDPSAETRVMYGPMDGSQYGWLSVTAMQGGYRVAGNANGVPAGTYRGEFYLQVDSPAHNVTVPVTLTVGRGLATPANVEVTIDSNTTLASAQLRGSIPVSSVTGVPIQWTASHDFNQWLTFTNSSGTTGSAATLDFVINPMQLSLDYSPHGEDWSTVTITPSIPTMTPVTFRVNVHKRLAQIFSVVPYVQILNKPSRHVIRGRNFIANRDWSQKLLIMGVPAGSRVTRVNDTKLLLDLGPMNFQQVVMEPTNELVAAPGMDPLRVIPEKTRAYAKIPTGFAVQTLVENSESDFLYLLERHADNPRFFTYSYFLDAWHDSGSTNIQGAKDVIQGIDGREMYAVGTRGISGVSSSASAYLPYVGIHLAPYNSPLVQTNERRLWFSTATLQLAYIDYPSGEIVLTSQSLAHSYQGPWFARSGDGDNLIISMTQGLGQYPALLMNTTDYQLRQAVVTGNEVSLIDGSVSDDGSRSVTSYGLVRDGQFNPIGSFLVEAPNWVQTAAVVSRDGKRVYAYAFDFDDFNANPTTRQPRIYVFDLTSPPGAGTQFPKLGYFTLPDYPNCMPGTPNCADGYPQMKISPDGKTLFLAGSLNLIVAPIPAQGALITSVVPPRVSKQRLGTTPWRVNTHAH